MPPAPLLVSKRSTLRSASTCSGPGGRGVGVHRDDGPAQRVAQLAVGAPGRAGDDRGVDPGGRRVVEGAQQLQDHPRLGQVQVAAREGQPGLGHPRQLGRLADPAHRRARREPERGTQLGGGHPLGLNSRRLAVRLPGRGHAAPAAGPMDQCDGRVRLHRRGPRLQPGRRRCQSDHHVVRAGGQVHLPGQRRQQRTRRGLVDETRRRPLRALSLGGGRRGLAGRCDVDQAGRRQGGRLPAGIGNQREQHLLRGQQRLPRLPVDAPARAERARVRGGRSRCRSHRRALSPPCASSDLT